MLLITAKDLILSIQDGEERTVELFTLGAHTAPFAIWFW